MGQDPTWYWPYKDCQPHHPISYLLYPLKYKLQIVQIFIYYYYYGKFLSHSIKFSLFKYITQKNPTISNQFFFAPYFSQPNKNWLAEISEI